MYRLIGVGVAVLTAITASFAQNSEPAVFKAGVAKAIITPEPGLWLAGYAGRNKPSEGKANDLYAKALALEDARGTRLVLVTLDVIGLPHDLSEQMYEDIRQKTNLPREAVVFACSHTHCGPVIFGNLMDMYPLTPDQPEKTEKVPGIPQANGSQTGERRAGRSEASSTCLRSRHSPLCHQPPPIPEKRRDHRPESGRTGGSFRARVASN
jgi:hypothetical protein